MGNLESNFESNYGDNRVKTDPKSLVDNLPNMTNEFIANMLNNWADSMEKDPPDDIDAYTVTIAIFREAARRLVNIDSRINDATDGVMAKLADIIRKAKEDPNNSK